MKHVTRTLRIKVPGRPAHVVRQGGVLRVGRHASNDLVLDDERVSRFHCLLAWAQDAPHPYVRDLGSQNGTRVDGEPVAEHALRGGEVLSLGPTRLRVELSEAAPALRPILPDDDDDDDDDAPLFDESDPHIAGVIGDRAALRPVIVVLEREHRTGTLHVACGALRARLTFAGGRVVLARLEQGDGPVHHAQAIRAIMTGDLTGGTYRFVPGIEGDAPALEGEAKVGHALARLEDLLEPIDLPGDPGEPAPEPAQLPFAATAPRPSGSVEPLPSSGSAAHQARRSA